jgi:hypothetical protein
MVPLDTAPELGVGHCTSITATLANLIIDYESELLGPVYGLIRQDLLHGASST